MADPLPKSILPYLEGPIGKLRIMRFWSKVDMRGPDECWRWQASLNQNGYGRFKLASYCNVTASRLALIATKREEPFGMLALHTCDNPACCNPAHLYFGTVQNNTNDKVQRDEPLHINETARLHYWRDKAIQASRDLSAIAAIKEST
jgi:hypothetical protein